MLNPLEFESAKTKYLILTFEIRLKYNSSGSAQFADKALLSIKASEFPINAKQLQCED